MIETIGLDKIRPSDDNLRRKLGDVEGLAASIAEVGLLAMPLVTPVGDGTYAIVAGHRRFAAITQLGWTQVEVDVREADEVARVQAMLVENLQREDLAPLEEAAGYRRMVEMGMTQADIARRTGCAQSQVSKRLALLDLPAGVAKALDSGGITLADAGDLARLAAWPDRLEAAFDHGLHYGVSIHRCVERELEGAAAEEKRVAAEATLVARKVRVIDAGGETSWLFCAQHHYAEVGKGPGRGPRLDMAVRTHAKLDCHAAMVDGRGDVHYLCTKPSNHDDDDTRSRMTSAQSKEKAEAAKRRAHNRELKIAAAGRVTLMQRLVKGRDRGVATFAVGQLLRTIDDRVVAVALDLLALDHPGTLSYGYSAWTANKKILMAHADRGDSFAAAALLALGFAVVEWEIGRGQWPTHFTGRHFAFLAERGYEPGSAEVAELDRPQR